MPPLHPHEVWQLMELLCVIEADDAEIDGDDDQALYLEALATDVARLAEGEAA